MHEKSCTGVNHVSQSSSEKRTLSRRRCHMLQAPPYQHCHFKLATILGVGEIPISPTLFGRIIRGGGSSSCTSAWGHILQGELVPSQRPRLRYCWYKSYIQLVTKVTKHRARRLHTPTVLNQQQIVRFTRSEHYYFSEPEQSACTFLLLYSMFRRVHLRNAPARFAMHSSVLVVAVPGTTQANHFQLILARALPVAAPCSFCKGLKNCFRELVLKYSQ